MGLPATAAASRDLDSLRRSGFQRSTSAASGQRNSRPLGRTRTAFGAYIARYHRRPTGLAFRTPSEIARPGRSRRPPHAARPMTTSTGSAPSRCSSRSLFGQLNEAPFSAICGSKLPAPGCRRHARGVPDHLSREGRSRNMAAIRSKNTKPELALRRALHARGVRGWRCHVRNLPGKPDLAFTRWKVAVFVDGAFWHGHPDHFTFGRGGYWDQKIARTQNRDQLADQALDAAGWTVLRFWDFEVNSNAAACAERVAAAVAASHADPSATKRGAAVRTHV